MESRAKILGHPAHQMLIVFPVGLLVTSCIFDFIGLFGDPKWHDLAFYLIGAGIVGGLLAAVFGLADYLAIPGRTRAKRVGTYHGVGNVIVLILFGASWYLRYDTPAAPTTNALLFSLVGLILAGVTAWLGGELVDRLGVGVDDGANLNAPSSLEVHHLNGGYHEHM